MSSRTRPRRPCEAVRWKRAHPGQAGDHRVAGRGAPSARGSRFQPPSGQRVHVSASPPGSKACRLRASVSRLRASVSRSARAASVLPWPSATTWRRTSPLLWPQVANPRYDAINDAVTSRLLPCRTFSSRCSRPALTALRQRLQDPSRPGRSNRPRSVLHVSRTGSRVWGQGRRLGRRSAGRARPGGTPGGQQTPCSGRRPTAGSAERLPLR